MRLLWMTVISMVFRQASAWEPPVSVRQKITASIPFRSFPWSIRHGWMTWLFPYLQLWTNCIRHWRLSRIMIWARSITETRPEARSLWVPGSTSGAGDRISSTQGSASPTGPMTSATTLFFAMTAPSSSCAYRTSTVKRLLISMTGMRKGWWIRRCSASLTHSWSRNVPRGMWESQPGGILKK